MGRWTGPGGARLGARWRVAAEPGPAAQGTPPALTHSSPRSHGSPRAAAEGRGQVRGPAGSDHALCALQTSRSQAGRAGCPACPCGCAVSIAWAPCAPPPSLRWRKARAPFLRRDPSGAPAVCTQNSVLTALGGVGGGRGRTLLSRHPGCFPKIRKWDGPLAMGPSDVTPLCAPGCGATRCSGQETGQEAGS